MGKNGVPALERAIRVMEALAEGRETTSLGLARQLGISQSSCYRILQTLLDAGWIAADEAGGYVFSLGLLPFVKPLLGVERVVDCVRPELERLAAVSGLSVKLVVRQGAEQVTVARAESPRPMGVTSPVGARYPVVRGASGACLLAPLDDARLEQVIAFADQEDAWGHESAAELRGRLAACRRDGICENLGSHPQGIDTMAVPLSTPSGRYALTLVGLRGDLDGDNHPLCHRELLAAGRALQRKLDALG